MLRFRYLVVLLSLGCSWLSAQTVGLPSIVQNVPAQSAVTGGAPITIDLRNHFGLSGGVTGEIVQLDTLSGRINLEMLAADAPQNVANFLRYVDEGRYLNTILHRSIPGFVIQGGGYYSRLPIEHIPTFPAVVNEFRRSNTRGTVAMAKLPETTPGGGPNSATSEWFINLANNAANLDAQNGGFTVFARVISQGMAVADAIAALPRSSDDFPLFNFAGGTPTAANLLTVRDVKRIPVYPTAGGGIAVLTFSATTQNANVAAVSVSGSTLTITPGTETGAFNLTARATDTNGQFAITPISITVTASTVAPTISRQPVARTVAAGGSAAFDVAVAGSPATYSWRKDGQAIAGATGPILLLRNVGAADAGTYSVVVTNSAGSVTSSGAALTVAAVGGNARLTNLSVRSFAGVGEQVLIGGFTVRGATASNLVIRGIGPTLGVFGVPGFLADPRLDLVNAQQVTVATNDDWSGADGSAVGGFALPVGSKDAVISRSLSQGGYTAQVKGAGTTTGEALVEVYEAPPVSATSELVNLSARTQLSSGQILIAGFNIGPGSARTVLVRAVGPALGAFGVTGVLANPRIELFSGGTVVGANDDWAGNTVLADASASVGAFPIADLSSRDSALLATLPSGGYTVQITGVGGASGIVLVELYLLP
jgi:cyclophilin family peptidyl-prolyl cis-trans isomerase